MKSHFTNEFLVTPGTQYRDHNYTLVAQSRPTGIAARPFTGLTRIHIRYNSHYHQYTIRSYYNAANLIENIIAYTLPTTFNLDHFINALLSTYNFKIVA